MKKIVYLFMILLIFFNIINVLALDECTTSELKRLKELAKNVEFKYEYEIVDDRMYDDLENVAWSAVYSITAYNLSDELRVRVTNEDFENYFTNNKPTINNFLNGQIVNIEITAYTANRCSGDLLRSVTIKLPYWNEYSLKDECKDYKDFKYCKEFGKFNISTEKFNLELEEYKKISEDDNNNDDDIITKVFDYKIYIIIGITSLIILITIFFVFKNTRKKEGDL